jgi:hypothetical protein
VSLGPGGRPCAHNTLGEAEQFAADLLGRSPPHEVRRYYASFSYPAQSWKKWRRVVAKVEWHPDELYPRVGFIVTNLARPAERIVAFYISAARQSNGSKKARTRSKWARLSCRIFAAKGRQGSGQRSSNSFSPCRRWRDCIAADHPQRCRGPPRKWPAGMARSCRAMADHPAIAVWRKNPAGVARLSCDVVRFENLGESRFASRAGFNPDFAQAANQRIRKSQIALSVVLAPSCARNDPLVEQMAVEHQPRDTIDQYVLRNGRLAADVLHHVMSCRGKVTALPATLVDSALAQRARKGPGRSWNPLSRCFVGTTTTGAWAILKWSRDRVLFKLREQLHHSGAPSLGTGRHPTLVSNTCSADLVVKRGLSSDSCEVELPASTRRSHRIGCGDCRPAPVAKSIECSCICIGGANACAPARMPARARIARTARMISPLRKKMSL